MITNNIPCNDCITLSMCLNKEARDVLDCPFVKEYIQKEPDTKNTASQHVNECISRWNSICSVLNIPKYKYADGFLESDFLDLERDETHD